MAADNNTASCVREMPLLNSLGINSDASATQRCSPRRRNLVRNALREVEKFFPRERENALYTTGVVDVIERDAVDLQFTTSRFPGA